jgi:hypothetical protein
MQRASIDVFYFTRAYGSIIIVPIFGEFYRKTVKVKPFIAISESIEGADLSCENNDLIERLLECEKELENRKDDLLTWTDSLEELSEIENAFATDGKIKLDGKTILDVGTDCVKPLYIALKFKPYKIIGISEDLSVYSFASDLEQKSKLFTDTKIRLYNCSLFDNVTLDKILEKEGIGKFDFVLVSKTLHHLRTEKCVAKERDEEHKCREDEECCMYGFEEQEVFKRLLELGKRVIVYEAFYPQEKDNDKVRGRGEYFTTKEWKEIFKNLLERYRVEFITPLRHHFDKKELESIIAKLRQVDCVCFYVEEQQVKNEKTYRTTK